MPDPARFLNPLVLERRDCLLVAVSGGGDSMALLDLARHCLANRRTGIRLVAATVDHGLRLESAAEAEMVARFCDEMGIEHRILRWDGAGTSSNGLIAAARLARYRLLARAAADVGSDIVLLGHTRDDQAETVAMRRVRRKCETGWDRGGAGMADATLFDQSVWMVRPLLDISRASLRRYLADRGLGWIDDPTNIDRRFERPRIRAQLSAGPDAERQMEELARAARKAGTIRAEMGRRAAVLIRHGRRVAPGLVRVEVGLMGEDDREAVIYLLRILLATVGGSFHLPDATRAERLLDHLKAGQVSRATLSRNVVEAHGCAIYLRRENRGVQAISAEEEGAIWDGRYRLVRPARREGITVAPLGADIAGTSASIAPGVPQRLVKAALSLEPGLWRGAVAVEPETPGAADGWAEIEPVAAPFARFLSDFDLDVAGAVQTLIGARPLPAPPWRNHNVG